MNDISGLVYLLNQAGIGLAQANEEIAELRRQLAEARQAPQADA